MIDYMRHQTLILVLVFFGFSAAAQTTGDYISWEEGRLLGWHHFKGAPDPADKVHAAVTYAGIDLQVERTKLKGELIFRARAVFDQQQSWAHPQRQEALILRHEQAHFDITEVYARKLEKKLNALKLRRQDKKIVKQLLDQYTRAQLATQANYDAQTVHGLHGDQQQAWRELIDRELANPSPRLELSPARRSLTAKN